MPRAGEKSISLRRISGDGHCHAGGEGVDERLPIWRAPAGAQIVICCGEETRGAAGVCVTTDGDVVKNIRVEGACSQGGEERVKKTDRGLATGGLLLIDQSGKTSPQ